VDILQPNARPVLQEKVALAGEACARGEFQQAVDLYTQAIEINPNNHVLYGNRSAACIRILNFEQALEDGKKAAELQPLWPKAHYRQGVALQCLGRHAEALAAFSAALAQDEKSPQLLNTLIDAAMKSPLKVKQGSLMYKELGDRLSEARELGNVGAVHVLMSQFDEAIRCHQEHLEIAVEVGDKNEEGRAYSNLGSVYHYKRDYEKAIYFHKLVLDVAKKTEDYAMEARAHAGLGHAYRCKGDVDQSRAFHERQLDVSVRSKDRATEGRALSNLGIILQQQEQYTQALKLHKAHLAICKETDDRAGQGRAYGNMGCAYSALGRYDQAIKFHKQELLISREVNDHASEACTHGNLAVAYQATGSLDKALKHYQQHLAVSLSLKDKLNEGTALFNLGNFYSSCGEFGNAIPYYDKFLLQSKQLKDSIGECKGCQNLGFAHYSLGNYSEAVKFYERNIALAQDLDDRTSLARAYCNIGLAYSALGNYDRALGNQKLFLQVSMESKDVEGVYKAHGTIGDIYMTLQDTRQGITNYKEQLRLAESMNNVSLLGDAYGTLGNAYRAAEESGLALDCHQRELNLRKQSNDALGTYRAFENLGSNYMMMCRYDDAHQCYNEQLTIANELGDGSLELQVYGNLGVCKLRAGDCQEALDYFEHQISFLERQPDAFLEIGRVHGNIGESHHVLGNHVETVKNFEKYLAAAQQFDSSADQDKAYRGLGNAHRAMGNLQESLVCFEKRLVVAHDLTNIASKGAAYGELGSLHKSLGNYEQAITCHEQQLAFARECGDVQSEADALSGLGLVSQKIGEYDRALKYHEQELMIVDQRSDTKRKAQSYHHVGTAHEVLGNYKQALIYQEQHLKLAAQTDDQLAKSQAYISLGRTYHAMCNYPQAISYLKQGLAIAETLRRSEDEARIRHRLGLSLLANQQLDASYDQLKRASELLETIRRDVINSGDFKISLYELQAACYQVLQRVLVGLGRHVDALAVAERARTRSFIDLLLERQAGSTNTEVNINKPQLDHTFNTGEQMMDFVRGQKSTILYYSVAAGHLYSWLMVPKEGLVKFRDTLVTDDDNEETIVDLEQSTSAEYSQTGSLLDSYITQVRDALGVEPHLNPKRAIAENDLEDTLEHESVLGISSVLSYLSADEDDDAMSITSTPGRPGSFSTPSHRILRSSVGKLNGVRFSGHGRSSKPPLRALYELLIAPMEDVFPSSTTFENDGSELVLVLQGDLYLVPFSVLRGSLSKEPLFRRFRLSVVPSLDVLHKSQEKMYKRSAVKIDPSSVLVVGNPIVPVTFGQWASNPSAEHEAKIVAELFKSKPLLGRNATKNAITNHLTTAQCVHFATHVSWKLAALILSPNSTDENMSSPRIHGDGLELLDDTDDSPALSEFLLTAADVLDLQLSSKLVVIGAAYDHSSKNRITSDGLIGLTRAFLAAGAQCVLVALWPVPDLACKLLLKAFYGGLIQGLTASHALSQAMHVVQKTKQFSHPSNWAGFVLIGGDPTLTTKEVRMGDAFGLLLNNPKFYREAMKVLVHLIDKALQRIRRGQRSSMYTAEASIDAKVKGVHGWRELLLAVGFRFQKAKNGLPDSVFFPPASDNSKDRLTLASNNLHAFLGNLHSLQYIVCLSPATLQALAKLASTQDVNLAVIILLNEVLACFFNNMANVQAPLKLKLWRTLGCHELLASLGFDLVGVGKEEVMLRSGKTNSRRALQCTVQALCALTGAAAADDASDDDDAVDDDVDDDEGAAAADDAVDGDDDDDDGDAAADDAVDGDDDDDGDAAADNGVDDDDEIYTVNPADSEESNFALMSKAHSSSTVMSNLSFVSASLGSDLDMRTKSAEDLDFLNRERRLGSSGSQAGRPRRHSYRSSTEALMRSLADLEAESSVDPVAPNDGATPTSAQSRPSEDRPTGQMVHGSQSSLARMNVNRSSSQRSKSSIDISGLRVSSVDVTPQPPRPDSPSDSSDVDSYSDIMGQQKRDSKDACRAGAEGKGMVLRKTHSSSSSASSIGRPEDSSSSSKTPGSINQLRTQQTDQRNVKKAAEKPAIPRRGASIASPGNTKPLPQQSTPNLYTEARKTSQKTTVNNPHVRTPITYRSEGNLASYHNPVYSNTNDSSSNGLLTTLGKNEVPLTNGDVRRPSSPKKYVKASIVDLDHVKGNVSLPNGGPALNRLNLRSLVGPQDRPKVNGITSKKASSTVTLSSDDEHRTTDDRLFYSQKSYAGHLRDIPGSNEYLPRTTPVNRVVTAQNTYTDRTRNRLPRGVAQGLSVHISTDSYSSQDSAESPPYRQIAAEHAAVALMQNHNDTGPRRSGSSLTKENLAMKELRDHGGAHVRLKQDHIANLAHLHSSSC
ncbi:hypothetical protein QZH41_018994, partial [Actinostola sp. cb2023]